MTAQIHDETWYLAQLKPNSGRIAARNLQRQGFRTFLPMEHGTKRARSKFVDVVRPLFPGYIFIAVPEGQGSWRAINSTIGVTQLVSFGSAPARVPDVIVSQILQRCDKDDILTPAPELEPGDRVRLTGGPFTEFVATIESLAPEKRVWVLLDVMGKRTRVALPQDSLRSA